MRILSVRLSNQPPFVCSCLLPLIEDGLFVSLMCRMPFYMAFLRKRCLCANHLDLRIPSILTICVVLTSPSMVLNKHLRHGIIVLAPFSLLMVLWHPRQTLLCLFFVVLRSPYIF